MDDDDDDDDDDVVFEFEHSIERSAQISFVPICLSSCCEPSLNFATLIKSKVIQLLLPLFTF